jgi:hypothetical protein
MSRFTESVLALCWFLTVAIGTLILLPFALLAAGLLWMAERAERDEWDRNE